MMAMWLMEWLQEVVGMNRILGFCFRKKYLELRACLFLKSFEWTD